MTLARRMWLASVMLALTMLALSASKIDLSMSAIETAAPFSV